MDFVSAFVYALITFAYALFELLIGIVVVPVIAVFSFVLVTITIIRGKEKNMKIFPFLANMYAFMMVGAIKSALLRLLCDDEKFDDFSKDFTGRMDKYFEELESM